LLNDPSHCGDCLHVCPQPAPDLGRSTCTRGVCGIVCNDFSANDGPTYTNCKGLCVNLETDEANCGVCGRACKGCRGGVCPVVGVGGTGGTGGQGGTGGTGGRIIIGPGGASDIPINRAPLMNTAGSPSIN
jgi:hypothetical protein